MGIGWSAVQTKRKEGAGLTVDVGSDVCGQCAASTSRLYAVVRLDSGWNAAHCAQLIGGRLN